MSLTIRATKGSYLAEMTPLLGHKDYRAWLAIRTEELKEQKPFFSYRYVCQKLSIGPSHFTRILKGSKHLALSHVPGIARLYGLDEREEAYLDALVHFNRARSARDSRMYFLTMESLCGVEHRTVDLARHEYFSRWQHVVMRTLLSLVEFSGKRHDRLGRLFTVPLSPEATRESVDLLVNLGLVEQDDQGIYRAKDRVLSTGDGWMSEAVQSFQAETLDLATKLLDTVAREDRDVSTLTIPMSTKHLGALKLQLREFRQQLIRWAKDLDHEDCVYHVNLQAFPVARIPR